MKKWTKAEHLPINVFPVWMPEHGPLIGILMLRIDEGYLVLPTEDSGKAETPWEESTVTAITPGNLVFADCKEDVKIFSGLVEIMLKMKDGVITLYQRMISIQGPEEEAAIEPIAEEARPFSGLAIGIVEEKKEEETISEPAPATPVEGEQVIKVEGGEVIIPAKAAEPITVTEETSGNAT